MAGRIMKIMAIDDNTVNLATIEQKLKGEYEVIPMINGRRALKYLYCEKVDLILLDVQMPMMDGVETLREIRKLENGVTVPVIFLTALKDKYTVIEGSKLGIIDYITKPFDAEDLKKRIDFAFKRVGIRPMEDEELLNCVKEILSDLRSDKLKQAASRMDELVGYKISEEVTGRVRNARSKLDKNDGESALHAIERVYQMLKSSMDSQPEGDSTQLSDRKLYNKLMNIKEALDAFRTKEAIEECQSLKHYTLPDGSKESIDYLLKKLMEYDDDGANDVLRELLSDFDNGMY